MRSPSTAESSRRASLTGGLLPSGPQPDRPAPAAQATTHPPVQRRRTSTSTRRNPRCRRIGTRNRGSGIGLCRLSALRRGSFRGLPSGSSDQHRPGDPHVIRLLLRVGDLPRQTHTGAATHLGVRPTGCRFRHPVGWDPTIHTIRASDLVTALVGTGRSNLAAPSARSAYGPAVLSETIHTSHFCSLSITTRARTGTQSSHPTAVKLSSYSEYRHSERSLGCFSRNRDRCFSHHDTSRPSGTTTSSPRREQRRRDAARRLSTPGVRRLWSRRRSPP